MTRAWRLLVSLVALFGLTLAVSGCGDDDGEDTAATTTTAETDETTTTAAEGEDEGDSPDVNPCAEGESGTLGPPPAAPAADATPVTITASEYTFGGLDALNATGEYAVTLENAGKELHEIVIQKIDDAETRPLEELLTVEDPSSFTTDVAFSFACPGVTAEPVSVNLETPGRYVALCFIPTGTLPETPPAEFENLGPPHAIQGMIEEINVS